MSFALYNELKKIREQILDLLVRIEALEEKSKLPQKREILTLRKPEKEHV